jgi:hypothetical protein
MLRLVGVESKLAAVIVIAAIAVEAIAPLYSSRRSL